jgi:phosphoserine phosphatase
MSKVTEILALIFDFDDTLVPDSTTRLLRDRGIDTDYFWGVQAKELIKQGYDQPFAYLKLMFDNIGVGKPLGNLTNSELTEFGATLDSSFHPGLPGFFDDIRRQVKDKHEDIDVEFYIISGGLQAVVEGSAIVKQYFSGVYGCQLAGDTEDGVLKYIKRCITFTEKTRYLFEINKGIDARESSSKPHLVNKYLADKNRKIPFRNMIYVGDGMTDIPCFSLVQRFKGKAFGVFDPSSESKAKLALEEFLEPHRVTGMHSPNYGKNGDLGIFLRAAVTSRCLEIEVDRRSPQRD